MAEWVVHDIAQGIIPKGGKGVVLEGKEAQKHPQHAHSVGGKAQEPEFPPQLFEHRPLSVVLQSQQGEQQHQTVHGQIGGNHQDEYHRKEEEQPNGEDNIV